MLSPHTPQPRRRVIRSSAVRRLTASPRQASCTTVSRPVNTAAAFFTMNPPADALFHAPTACPPRRTEFARNPPVGRSKSFAALNTFPAQKSSNSSTGPSILTAAAPIPFGVPWHRMDIQKPIISRSAPIFSTKKISVHWQICLRAGFSSSAGFSQPTRRPSPPSNAVPIHKKSYLPWLVFDPSAISMSMQTS